MCADVLEFADGLADIVGGEFVELLIMAEDDDGDFDLTEDGQLVGLLEQAAFALEESSAGSRSVTARSCFGYDENGNDSGGGARERAYTERFLSSLMALISIFRRPMVGELRW